MDLHELLATLEKQLAYVRAQLKTPLETWDAKEYASLEAHYTEKIGQTRAAIAEAETIPA